METYLNLTIITMDKNKRIIDDGFISIQDDKIIGLGTMCEYETQNETIIDGQSMIVMPGLINAHTHLGLIPLRSLGEDMPDRLRRFLFPMEKELVSESFVEKASIYGAYESLLNGTTCVADMYYFSDVVAKALHSIGIRALVGQTIVKDNQVDYMSEKNALNRCKDLIKQTSEYDLIEPMIAPHSPVTVSKQMLKDIHQLSKETQTKVMMHVAEMDYEMKAFLPLSPVEYCHSLGILDSNFIAVHAIHTNEKDQKILSETESSVVHCVGANMKSAKGIADVKGFMQHQINVALGSDGPISGNTLDMFTVMKMSAMAQKTKHQERDLLPAYTVLEMATINAAKILGIDHLVGSLEIGKQADMVFLSTQQANMFPLYDPVSAIVYQAQPQNVHSVFVAGKKLVSNHQLTIGSLKQAREDLLVYYEQIKSFIQNKSLA